MTNTNKFPENEKEYKTFFKSLIEQKIKEKMELFETITRESILNEVAPKLIVRVNFRGQRLRKRICPKGFHLVGTKCVPFKSKERVAKKLAIRKSVRTKKADITGKKRSIRKRILAIKKRRQQGLK